MTITIVFIILLLFIAALSNSVMDVISFKFDISIFSHLKKWENWFNPSQSWKNKYKNKNPQNGAAFFGSTTFLVWITDAWHFFKMIMLSCFSIAIILGINSIAFSNYNTTKLIAIDISLFLIIKTFHGLVFELFWKNLFIKDK
jgi:hypothetical protein